MGKYVLYNRGIENTWMPTRDSDMQIVEVIAKSENHAFYGLSKKGKEAYFSGRFRFVPVKKIGKETFKPLIDIRKIKTYSEMDKAIYKYEKEKLGKVL